MVDPLYAASAALMTLFVVAVVGLVLRLGDWTDYSPTGKGTNVDRLRDASDSPAVWMLSFVALLVVFGGGTVLFVSGAPVPGASVIGTGLAAAGGIVFGGALFVGVYTAARSRGRPAAQGVAEGSVLVGLLVVAVIAVMLVA